MVTESTPAPSVDALLAGVGSKVRAMRKEQGLTLANLAELTGLSPAIVSQVERGLANPSFTTLAQLAHGLEIPVGKLIPDHAPESRSPVVRKADRRDLRGVAPEALGEAAYELLTPDLNGTLEANWVVTPHGHDTSDTPFTHGGEEFGIVLSGKKDVYLNGQRYVLEAGDSITFNSTIPHWFTNSYDETCVAVWVNSPPTW
ncbi:helix-turn-helix domain-containing protein [Spelaeicoccus albus]|uniref:Transcriptional regulator with XRE-family HTH domain n=1 Tax=Spelaeicoccus albus TaxID=1280376 RepID=A0A7Z0D3R0_9MICO|nr:cupin domain-containing protein [Spelaeicoccus albus]NYI68275.1 transcriptional regulator with XRE-family HTH domain [Spelaeicoccus albus]